MRKERAYGTNEMASGSYYTAPPRTRWEGQSGNIEDCKGKLYPSSHQNSSLNVWGIIFCVIVLYVFEFGSLFARSSAWPVVCLSMHWRFCTRRNFCSPSSRTRRFQMVIANWRLPPYRKSCLGAYLYDMLVAVYHITHVWFQLNTHLWHWLHCSSLN